MGWVEIVVVLAIFLAVAVLFAAVLVGLAAPAGWIADRLGELLRRRR